MEGSLCRQAPLARNGVAVDGQHRGVADPAKVRQARSATEGDALAHWATRFDLLSDPNRLRLLMAIHAAPGICVSDLAAATGISATAASQALRLLRSADWVTARRDGRMVLYTLDDNTVHDLLHMLRTRPIRPPR